MTLWNLKTYNKTIIKLKVIKYKEDNFYYLSFLHFDLAF